MAVMWALKAFDRLRLDFFSIFLIGTLCLQITLGVWLLLVIFVEVTQPLIDLRPHLVLVHVLLLVYFLGLSVVGEGFKGFPPEPNLSEFVHYLFLSISDDPVFLHQKVLELDPSQHASPQQIFVVDFLAVVNAIESLLLDVVLKDSHGSQLKIEILECVC